MLSVVGTGTDLAQARERAYEAAGHIRLAGSQHRTDIASAAIAGDVIVPDAPGLRDFRDAGVFRLRWPLAELRRSGDGVRVPGQISEAGCKDGDPSSRGCIDR